MRLDVYFLACGFLWISLVVSSPAGEIDERPENERPAPGSTE